MGINFYESRKYPFWNEFAFTLNTMIFHKQLYATPCQLVVQRYPYYIRSDFKVGFFQQVYGKS